VAVVAAQVTAAATELQVAVVLLVLAEQIQVVVVEAVVNMLTAQQAAQVLSSFPTLAHKEAQAAQSHQAVATPFIHLHHQALTLPNLIF
jgi:hypothetical protein